MEKAEMEKRFEFTCPFCGKKQYAQRSIFQLMGMNDFGHGDCIKCKEMLHLSFDETTNTMAAEKWDDWVAKLNAEKENK